MGIRDTLRTLITARSLSLTAFILAAVGVGTSMLTFAVLRAVLNPLPFAEPERLVILWARDPVGGIPVIEISHKQLDDWMSALTTLEGASLVSASNARMNFVGRNGDGLQVLSSEVSANFCDLLGLNALAGRCFTPRDGGRNANQVAMLANAFWHRAYGGSPDVIGESVRLNGTSTTVIGVLPSDAHIPDGADVITPARRGVTVPEDLPVYLVVARMAQHAQVDDVRAEVDTVLSRDNQDNLRRSGWVVAVTPLERHIFGDTHAVATLIALALAAVLIIAASNLTSLLLARSTFTARETAIRSALGATQAQLARDSLLQSIALCLPGALVGIVLVVNFTSSLVAIVPDVVPRGGEIVVDWPAVSFALVVTIFMACTAGLPPALRTVQNARRSVAASFSADIATVKFRTTLVVIQVALAVLLLAGATLVVRSFKELEALDGGFAARGLLTAKLNLGPKYHSVSDRSVFFKSVLERLETLPPVESADVVLLRPLAQPIGWDSDFTIEGQDDSSFQKNPFANLEAVSGGYFRTMRIPLVRGRTFTDSDGSVAEGSHPPVIVSENLARRYWPGEDPIGKRLKFGSPENRFPWSTVIGVVGNVRYRQWTSQPLDIYVPYQWWNFTWMDIVVRATGESDAAIVALRTAVSELDPEVTLSEFEIFEHVISNAVAGPRFTAALGGGLAAVSLILAGTGVYGLLAFSVAQRRREISVRIVVGATRGDILRLVLTRGVFVTTIGLLAGLGIFLPLTSYIASRLYGVSQTDVLVHMTSAAFLLAVALVAGCIPAQQATRVQPTSLLRHE